MGWFDEDDSEEEKEEEVNVNVNVNVKQAAISFSSTISNSNSNSNTNINTPAAGSSAASLEEEEEDPLDAYMKSLQPEISKPSKPRAERLDVDNADEATSHWKERDANEDERENENNDEEANEASSSTVAISAPQQALESTFRKAGGGSTTDNTNVSIQLMPVQHDQIKYQTFQRVLLLPNDGKKETMVGKNWRKEHHVTCTPTAIDPITSFADIDSLLTSTILTTNTNSNTNSTTADITSSIITQQIAKCGYTSPTPVQAQTLAVAMAGYDALVTASTGSGKTMAYVWPMLFHIQQFRFRRQDHGPKGLILVPTRELALQVHKQVKQMTVAKGASIAITGGVNRYQLVQDLKKHPVQIVVATPGRLLDVLSIKKNGLSLQHVTFLVLDECDKMLDMGFEEQVSQLLRNVRPDRQSLLLSATLGRKVERVATQWMSRTNSIRIAVGHTGRASDHVQQHVMVLPNFSAKQKWLQEMLPILAQVGLTLCFVATRVDCETLARAIQESNPTLPLATLHGDKHATDRHAALRAFGKKDHPINTLICTDVASRGLDLHVATVISFDPAKNLDIHVHRIGRAGRLAKKEGGYRQGTSYTLLNKKNADFAHVLMQSFEREGREISPELRQLANESRRSGNTAGASREKWNKAGLGFDDGDKGRYGPASSRSEDLNKVAASSGGSYYGPPSSVALPPPPRRPHEDASLTTQRAPPAKKSRWG